jgi:hypothetical protein
MIAALGTDHHVIDQLDARVACELGAREGAQRAWGVPSRVGNPCTAGASMLR